MDVKALCVYITTSSVEEAEMLSKKLVEQRLAACANVVRDIKSFYWWDGNVQNDHECLVLAKTTVEYFDKINELILQLHSYDNPCIVALPIVAGNGEYLNWIKDNVA